MKFTEFVSPLFRDRSDPAVRTKYGASPNLKVVQRGPKILRAVDQQDNTDYQCRGLKKSHQELTKIC